MKLCLISDTQNQHEQVKMPYADILIHAGDLTMSGTVEECRHALRWLNSQPYEHIVMVAGNHDFAFEHPDRKKLILEGMNRIHYLENEGTTISGLKIWGSPVTPWFCDWAFNVNRGSAIKKIWDTIPENTDVLITHGPPMGILDQSVSGKTDHLGCEELAERIETVVLPKIHVFGHIHGGYGSKGRYHNASVVNEAYQVSNSPIVVEI